MMKRRVAAGSAFFLLALIVCLSGCETEGKDDKPPVDNTVKAPTVLADGIYLPDTRITMRATGADETVKYTFDGSEPELDNPNAITLTQQVIPRMSFGDDGKLTVKVRAHKEGKKSSNVVTRHYTERVHKPTPRMAEMKERMQAAAGTNINNPFKIELDDEWTMDDVAKKWNDLDNPTRGFIDGLYYIFDAMKGDQFYSLDMSKVATRENWLDYNDEDQQVFAVMGCTNQEILNDRPNRMRLVGVIFPPDVEYIGAQIFRGDLRLGSNLRNVQLRGLSKLISIGSYAFEGCGSFLPNFDVAGCTSLRYIKTQAFAGSFPPLSPPKPFDFSMTVLENIGEKAINGGAPLYIEYPRTLTSVGQDPFGGASGILYVRHRSLAAPVYGYNQYNNHNGGDTTSSGTHVFEGADSPYVQKNDHTFPIFIPNVIAMRKEAGGFWNGDDDGYRWVSQSVPMGSPVTSADWEPANDPFFYDDVRGADLLTKQESYRGLPSLTINARGLTGVDGQTVTAAVNGVSVGTAQISDGAFTLTINTPPTLIPMTPDNFQEVTIPYKDPRNTNPNPLGATGEVWSIGTGAGVRSGVLGLPHINNTPANGVASPRPTTYEEFYSEANKANWPTNTANYGVLKLTLPGGKEVLNQTSDVREVKQNGQSVYSEQRTVTYVFVDADRYAHRIRRGSQHSLPSLAMSIKKGWNYVETCIRVDSAASGPAPQFSPEDPGYTSVWISGGIIGDNPAGVLNASTQLRINSKPIGWVVK